MYDKDNINNTINMKKIYIFITLLFLIIITQMIYLNYVKRDYYMDELNSKKNVYIYGKSAPRGRILDANGKVIVDNKEVYVINYVKTNKSNHKSELEIAYFLADIFDYEIVNDTKLCEYLIGVKGSDYLLTKQEKNLVEKRKLNSKEIKKIQLSRCDISEFDEQDKEAISIYLKMNEGFSYERKELIKGVSYEDFALIAEEKLQGILPEISYERVYPYNESLSSILGEVGPIYEEEEKHYKSLGYSLADEVGVSYLEKEYEQILKGKKAIYKYIDDNYELIKNSKRGNDLYLSIDMDVQLELETIMEKEMIKSKNYQNTDYFSDSYAIISEPNSGKIIAMSGKRLVDNNENFSFNDITNLVLSSSYTPGSIVKAASLSVGYSNNLIEYDKYVIDSCVKLHLVPEKCSWKSLGPINDIKALSLSSNYYQYLIAIGLTGNKYSYNIDIKANKKDFKVYRDMFKEYGLGSYTNIDLPNETTGVEGNIVASDLLLNLAIGQYDTYTILQMAQYINTVANNRKRVELSIGEKAYNSNLELVFEKNNKLLNTVSINNYDFSRIQEGLNLVTKNGTGYGYFPYNISSAGKTGTSESFLDSDNDGNIDTKTYTKSFIGYAPFENPKYSIVVVAPHVSYDDNSDDPYIYNVSRYITQKMTSYLFK